jgi:hypothetical protein
VDNGCHLLDLLPVELRRLDQTTSSEGDQLKHATVESVSDEVGSSKGPDTKGASTATGEGSTVDNGCHLLDLLPVELRRLDGVEAS